jgi:hypothetical protein
MPTRATFAGSEVPSPAPPRRWGEARPCSPATSFRPVVLRTYWTPSPCRRLSRPPWWRVTATTTTGPPPRPDGNSGRCTCPKPKGLAGTAGTLPTFTHRPVGRVGAELYPGGIATRYRNPARGLDRPNRKRSAETIPSNKRDRAPQQPIAASFGAAVLYRGFAHWFVSYAFLPCYRTRPAGGGRCSIVRGALALHHTSGLGLPLSFTRPLRRPGAGSLTPPGHMAPRGAVPQRTSSRSTGATPSLSPFTNTQNSSRPPRIPHSRLLLAAGSSSTARAPAFVRRRASAPAPAEPCLARKPGRRRRSLS